MHGRVKVSVIIPACRAQRTIRRCLKSCLRQNLAEWEALVIVNGPPDHTERIARGFGDSRISVFRSSKTGVSAARNLGMVLARGEYLLFLDSDDELHPSACRRLFGTAKEYDLDIAGISVPRKRLCPEAVVTGEKAFSCLSYDSVRGNLYRREMLAKNGLRFDEAMQYGEDRVFVCEAAAAANLAGVTGGELYYYRYRNASLSGLYHPSMETCMRKCAQAGQKAVKAHPVLEHTLLPGEAQSCLMQVYNLYALGAPFTHRERADCIRKIAGRCDPDVLLRYLPRSSPADKAVICQLLSGRPASAFDLCMYSWKKIAAPVRNSARSVFREIRWRVALREAARCG